MNQPLAGRYQFEAEIARGAAGVVHRARDLITGEAVAVKVLHAEAADEPVMAAAFLDEAEVLSELNHPGIVRPRDLIVNGNLMALVMDLVDGVDLRRVLLDEGPLSPVRAAEVTAELSQVLSVIHQAGIVHGDVKPGNILLPTDGGPARLIDFGVARRIASPEAPTHGTPDYTAPEIIEGRPSSAKSDVYGVGLVLFEALCGRNPYRGGSIDEVLERHRISIPMRPEQVPAELWSVIESCLALRPQARPDADAIPSMLRAVTPLLSQVPAAALTDLPTMRSRPRESVSDDLGGIVTPVPLTPPTAATPDSDESIDAMFGSAHDSLLPEQAPKGRKTPMLLAGAATAIVAFAAVAIFALGGFSSSPGVVSEQKDAEQTTSESPAIEETDTESTPSQEPSEDVVEPSEEADDSNQDGDTDVDTGDESDTGESDQDIPGEDLIGSPMPGNTGGN